MESQEQRSLAPNASSRSSSVAVVFDVQGLLPHDARLLLNVQTNTVILLRFEGTALASTHRSFHLTPSATRIFLCLLQAYPAFCSYRSLFLTLYPLPKARDGERLWQRDLALRPIRRTLGTLLPALRSFGLQVVALRGQGYLLAAADSVDLV